jgi:hypothetical protein
MTEETAMRNRKAARGAARAIALVGVLALGSAAHAGGLDDPGDSGMCGVAGCTESTTLTTTSSSTSPTTATATSVLLWRLLAIWLLRH